MVVESRIVGNADNAEHHNVFNDLTPTEKSRQHQDLIDGIGALAMLRRLLHIRKLKSPAAGPTGATRSMRLFPRSHASGAIAAPDPIETNSGGTPERSAFIDCPLFRSETDSRRIVYVGELTPRSGVLDFLSCAVNWADANPTVPVDILWVGDGDLRGILQAQPTPGNLRQSFDQIPDASGLSAIFARCGLMVVPYLADLPFSWLPEAMAAGLPVLGSLRGSAVRRLVTSEITGWLFDPARDEDIARAFSLALTATTEQLNTMRTAARARVKAAFNEPHVRNEHAGLTEIGEAMANSAVA
jgi:glycosyltransferase involved in cell wall biosynthesis